MTAPTTKLPLIRGDAVLLEQVIFYLLDNAHTYSDPADIYKIDASENGGQVTITVNCQQR